MERLCRELRLPAPLCRLLVGRGFAEPAAAREFLRPHAGQLHAPALAGIGEAVARLGRAIREQETILVHGDYDVDGICATALYVRALRMFGARVEAFVPHRLEDGYDLSAAGVAAAVSVGARLILTADCGIVAHDAIERARSAGIDVIVTDHHRPGATLPAAVAVVNPNRADCAYPNKGLAGVGVAYKVCVALASALGYPPERLGCFVDLVALATIADMAPLTGENRALVRWGLKVLRQTPNPGLQALLIATGLDRREILAGQVGYILAPRINAVGRMGEALRGVRLLLTDDWEEAQGIARLLEAENRSRQSVEAETLREALDLLARSFDPDRDRGVVLAAAGWHPGVIGIVASRIVERIHRPTVLIALDATGEGKGSARSVPGFDLYEALRACSAHLKRFGGHRAAAGCTIHAEQVAPFRDAFNAYAAEALCQPDQLVPQIRIDLELELHEADAELYRLLRYAAPFGHGNATPILAARRVRLDGAPRLVGRDHLKLRLAAPGAALDAVGWGLGHRLAELPPGAELDVAFKLEENSWNGRTALQAQILDWRRPQPA